MESGEALDPTTRARPPSSVATQIRPSPSTSSAYTVLEGRLVGSAGSCRNTLTMVPSCFARSRPPSSVPSQTLPLAVLGDRRDARRADRAANGGAEGELANQAGRRVDHIGAAVVHAEPDAPVAALVNGLNAFGARAARIARFDRNGFEPPARPSIS